jgi:hypothetical protein
MGAEAHRLVVAVAGHRNLVESELGGIEERATQLFDELQRQYPWTRLTVMSPLAEGADLLVAEVAVRLGLDLVVPLPKPRAAYMEDFTRASDRERFERLCSVALSVFVVEGDTPPAPEGTDPQRWARDYPYARLGIYLSAHCHILVAVWDGRPSGHLGGTAQVVRFHQDDVMPGVTPVTVATQQMLVDDESDLVFHIVCSRIGREGATTPGLRPGEALWYSKDSELPRGAELPAQHRLIFKRQAEFSDDATRFAQRIERKGRTLLETCPEGAYPGIEAMDRLFRVADWLAIHYQRRTLWMLSTTYFFAFLTGQSFLLYTDYRTAPHLLHAFLTFVLIAAGAQLLAKRGSWHRKYLDYRTLAEGLRVQTYWAAAGVTPELPWKFPHDSYLRGQNPELGWIRNVMRVAGLRYDASPARESAGVSFAVREWVGGDQQGQLGYFRRRARDRVRRHARTQLLGRLSLAVSVATVLSFVVFGAQLSPNFMSVMTVVMGTSLLIFTMLEGYAHATAVKELIKQYEFMLQTYENAHRRIVDTQDFAQRRQILLALGQSAMDEHSDWLLMHRERLFEDVKIWKLGG